VTVARTLPASLPPRFRSAPRTVARSADSSFELVVAEGFWIRLRGLAGLAAADLVPLLFPRCRSLHTFGMRAPIDIVWLDLASDGAARVVATDPSIAPRGLARAPRGSARARTAALELPAGDAEALGLAPDSELTVARSAI
jgi:uncharacterized membrane protein (UPF0127 family)